MSERSGRLGRIFTYLNAQFPPAVMLPSGVATFLALHWSLQALAGQEPLVFGARAIVGRERGRVLLERRAELGIERGSRVLQFVLKSLYERVRAAEHAPRGRFQVLEQRHGLAEIVERGAVVLAERLGVFVPHPDRSFVALAKNALRDRYHFT